VPTEYHAQGLPAKYIALVQDVAATCESPRHAQIAVFSFYWALN
jgi:hypothetical protein